MRQSSDHKPQSMALPSLYPTAKEIDRIEHPCIEKIFAANSTQPRTKRESSDWTRRYNDQLKSYQAIAKKPATCRPSQPMKKKDPPKPVVAEKKPRGEERSRFEIEVSPDYFLPLHGSADTMKALQHGRIARSCCFACQMQVYCTDEATFVLCPDCRVVSPLRDPGFSGMSSAKGSGVGLGMSKATYEETLGEALQVAQGLLARGFE